MSLHKSKKSPFLKKLWLFCMLFFLTVFSLLPQRAHAWTSLIAGVESEIKMSLEKTWEQVKGTIIAAAKDVAATTLMEIVTGTIGGGGGKPMFITDWQDYLRQAPQRAANLVINDFISKTVGGSNSSLGEGAATAYTKRLAQWAAAETSGAKLPTVDYSLKDGKMFDKNLKGFNLYLSGINNPWAYNATISQVYMEEIARQQDVARTEGLAGAGYLSTKSGGKVTLPGISKDGILQSMNDFQNKIMAAAETIPETLGAAIGMVTKGLLMVGIGAAQSFVQQQINENIVAPVNEKLQPYRPYINLAYHAIDSATTPSNAGTGADMTSAEAYMWANSDTCKNQDPRTRSTECKDSATVCTSLSGCSSGADPAYCTGSGRYDPKCKK